MAARGDYGPCMPKVIVQKWEESERGWGTRPDGYSIHKSRDDLRQYLADEWAAEKQRNPSGVTPDEYTRTSVVAGFGEKWPVLQRS